MLGQTVVAAIIYGFVGIHVQKNKYHSIILKQS